MRYRIIAAAWMAMLAAACDRGPNDGFTQTRADATPYQDARERCAEAWGAPMNSSDNPMARDNAHRRCMSANGWEDLVSPF